MAPDLRAGGHGMSAEPPLTGAEALALLEADTTLEAARPILALAAEYLTATRSGEGPVSTWHSAEVIAEKRDQSKGGVDGRRRAHLQRRKMQTRTEIHMPPYVVQGNVHIDVWEELLDTIDRDQRFMPLTEVRIQPALTGGASAFDFVAVNKDHVAYLSESSG